MIAFFLIIYFVALLVGLPMITSIGFAALALTGCYGAATGLDFSQIAEAFVSGAIQDNSGLTVLLFVIAGDLMSQAQITDKIFNIFAYFLGKKRGFMPILAAITCMFYGAISGSGIATCVAVGALCFPMLVKLGYDRIFAAGIIVAAGCLGTVIPPSIPLTMCSSLSGGLDQVVLYKLGAILGVVCGVLMCLYCYFYCRVKGNGNQTEIDRWVDNLREKGLGNVVSESIWALLMPVIILGSIFLGIADTAQSAALSVVYALFIGRFVYRTFDMSTLPGLIVSSIRNSIGMLAIVTFAKVFNVSMGALNVGTVINEFITAHSLNGTVLMLLLLLLMLLLGTCNAGGITIFVPIAYPVMVVAGLDPYVCCVAMVIMQTVGQLTPPIGTCLFVMLPQAECDVLELGKKVIPYWIIMCGVCAVVVLFPGIFASLTAGAVIPIP